MMKSGRQVLDFIQMAVILTDMHSKIVFTNRYTERLFGYPREEIEGQRLRILFLEEDLTYFLPNIVYLTLYKNGFAGEALLRQKDGKKIFVHISSSSFKEGGEVFLAFSIQEIQRLKKLERERLEMERWASLGMMIEEIAHQIRNPIASIGGYVKRLSKISPSLSSRGSYLDRILQETRKLEVIIQRVEEYVLISRANVQREKIQDVIEAALQTLSVEATEKDISFRIEARGSEGDGYLFIDRGLVIKALCHILRNSMESIAEMPRGKERKTVKVAFSEDGENIEILISDKGEGISKKNLSHIFEPFFSTRPDRIGLGLTFVKKVLEEHGGGMRVDSRLKSGTRVILTFPKDRRRKVRRELISAGSDSSPSPSV
ncbi:MAG: nitrogen regulation protein NR(II) [Thermodesulfobacteriota bacterium]